MANNNVIMISLKAIVTLNHFHNHMLVESEKLKKIKEIQCIDTSMEVHTTENKLNILHFDKFNRTQQNTALSNSQVSIKNNIINTSTTELDKKLSTLNKTEKKLEMDNNKIIEPTENDNFELSEEYDKYILVENVHMQSLFCDNNENELNQLMSDYNAVNEKIFQQFRSNPNFFKKAIKDYTLAMKNSLTSKESLLNTLHSFGEQLKEKRK